MKCKWKTKQNKQETSSAALLASGVKISCPSSLVVFAKQTISAGQGHNLNTQYMHSVRKYFN